MELRTIDVIAGLVLLAAAAWMVGSVSRNRRLFEELANGLRALADGQHVRPIRGTLRGSLGTLLRTYNEAVPTLEEKLTQAKDDLRLLRMVLSGMTEGVIAIDARRRLLFANDAADRLFGLGPDAVGRLIAELIRNPKVQEAVDATLSDNLANKVEIQVQMPDGRGRGPSRCLVLHGTPMPGFPTPGAVVVFHDVTDLRRLERMRQDFVANASHELKTPLASIKAYTETLLDGAIHDESVNVRFLHQIEDQADRLNRLILDLLSLARLESGQDFFQHGPLALEPVLRDCAEAHRDRAEAKTLRYTVDLENLGEDAEVMADEEAIRMVLDNLIDNAIKYTPEGGRVRVAGRTNGEMVELAVIDTGIGIPRDELSRVFERFYRVDKARSRALGGTGLGLSIVKHILQSLGGTVSVESRINAGSTFTVRIPLSKVASQPAADPAGSS